MSSAKDFVESIVHDPKRRVVVFGKSGCSYTQKAITALSQVMDPNQITTVMLDQRDDTAAIQEYLGQVTGATTVPRVFIDGVFFGDGSEVESKAQSQELQMTLQQKGIIQGA